MTFQYLRRGAERCPRCGREAVNVQGVADCPNCSWADAGRSHSEA